MMLVHLHPSLHPSLYTSMLAPVPRLGLYITHFTSAVRLSILPYIFPFYPRSALQHAQVSNAP